MDNIKKVMGTNGNLHNCKYYIEHFLCLGCRLAEQNINADNCEYREKSGLEKCKELLEGKQMK